LKPVTPLQETITVTAVPTKYPTAFAEQKVAEYLRTNNGCSLPCFWGIVTGETNLQNAIDFFQPFGITEYHQRSGESAEKQYDVSLYISSKDIQNGESLFEENGKIVGAQIFGEGQFDDNSSFWDIWEIYLPQNILTKYGYPERIWFDTYNNPEVPDPERPLGYSIWFFYDERDFLIVYSGITTKSPRYQVCLGTESDENKFGNLNPEIELLIHSNTSLEDFAIEREIDRKVNFYTETNVEIPIDEFRNMITNENGCFNTPLGYQP
jgi:hypothetical protein